MKKISLFSLSVLIAACTITPLLKGAEQPPSTTEEQLLEAYWLGQQKGLGPYEIAALQKQLKLVNAVAVKVINDEITPIGVIFHDLRTGYKIASTQLNLKMWHTAEMKFIREGEEKLIKLPLIPLKVIVYIAVHSDGKLETSTKTIGSFVLSVDDLSNIASVEFHHAFAVLINKNGTSIRKDYTR